MKRYFLFPALNLFFSGFLGALLIFPGLLRSAAMRRAIAFGFGRILAPRYGRIIATYGDSYGEALAAGLDASTSLAHRPLQTLVDCGTGTGFVSLMLAKRFRGATLIGVDAVLPMLAKARENMAAAGVIQLQVCADLSDIPLADGCADLVVAQNTAPLFAEFARICAPGGVVVFADSSARLVDALAARAMRRTGLLEDVRAEARGSGFFVVARRR